MIWGCAIILGTFLGGCSWIFGYLFWAIPGFLGTISCYSRIFGYHFLVKFDFFKNNSDFGVLILIFPSMTLWNIACRALVSVILQCLCKDFHIVYNCYQFEFVYLQCF